MSFHMSAKLPRVLLADDHVLLLEAFKKLLEPICQVDGAVTDGRALVEAALKLEPILRSLWDKFLLSTHGGGVQTPASKVTMTRRLILKSLRPGPASNDRASCVVPFPFPKQFVHQPTKIP